MKTRARRQRLARGIVPKAFIVTLALSAIVGFMSRDAWANPTVTIPAAYPHSSQVIIVTGSGFPGPRKIPTGIQIIECSDPGGKTANLPTNSLMCDGTTQNPGQINTDLQGNFSTHYSVYALNSARSSNINCDKTHYCVLWVGVDYNQSFLGMHAFSAPFEVGGTSPNATSGSGIEIWIPIVVVIAVGAALLLVWSRRRQPAQSSSRS